MRYTPTQIQQWGIQSCSDGKTWKPARSINHTVESFKSRVINAWGVLTGKYDALDWQDRKGE